MQYLKADTAATILIGPFVDKGDGVTPETGITLAAADSAELMKHDGTTFVDLTADSRTFTHKEKGMYTLALGTGDTDTEGRLTVFISDESVCLPVWKDFMVMNAPAYDALYASAGTDYLPTDVTQIAGATVATGSAQLGVNVVNIGASAAAGVLETAVDNGLDNAIGGSPTADSVAQRIKAIDLLIEASGGGDLAAILGDTNELQGLIAASKIAAQVKGMDDIDLSATMKTSVNAEVVDALGTDTLSELSQGIPAATPTMKAALMLLYMIARNQLTTTSTELGVYNDTGTKIAKKVLSDDGTTYNEAEMVSGA